MASPNTHSISQMPLAGLLTWLVPGLGHVWIGDRARGCVFFVTVTATFWSGVAIGGVGSTVDPHGRKLWFMAQIVTGGNTLSAYALHQRVLSRMPPSQRRGPIGHWRSIDAGIHYTGVAGLLNLLVILDAIARADPEFVRRRNHRLADEFGVT